MYEFVWPEGLEKYERFPQDHPVSPEIALQDEARVEAGWIPALAAKAEAFHRASEEAAKLPRWADKLFVFYAIGHDTTGGVSIQKVDETVMVRSGSLREDLVTAFGEEAQPSVAGFGSELTTIFEGRGGPATEVTRGGLGRIYQQWVKVDGKIVRRRWELHAYQVMGDGTVPSASAIGIGGPAKIFRHIEGNPDHVAAPGSRWVWRRVVEVLQGHDVTEHLAKNPI
jgi:hypothetical protein